MMKTLAIFATLATVAFAQTTLTLNTPASLVVCEPAQLTWTDDGNGPFFLSILPGNQPSAAPLKQFPPITGTSVTWLVDIAANTLITGALRDQTGQQVFTSAITIQSGSNSSCVNSNVSEGSSAASGASSASSSGSSAPAASGVSTTAATGASSSVSGATPASSGSTAPKSSSGSTSPSSSGASPSQSGSSSTNKNGASRGTVSVGAFALTGLMGLVGAALL